MNQMEIFKNPEFGSIRVIEENGKYLFCGTDVAAALGYSNPRDAIIRHCRYVVKRDAPHPQSPDRKISMTFIPEGDLYRLIVHSKLPSAEQFEQWVFDEVLPTIRKHGAYLTREKLWEVATSPEALMKLCSDLLAEREANISLRKENAQLEGKAAFYDLFIDLKHSTNLRTTAKELDVPERRFVRFLIPKCLVDCLRETKENSISDYVIADSKGEPLAASQFQRVWQYVVVRSTKPRNYYKYVNGESIKYTVTPTLGMTQKNQPKIKYTLDFDVTPHQLRHTYITNLLYAGVDPKTVQYLAGHENSKTTMDIYAKVKYNKPEELFGVVNGAFHQAIAE